MQDFFKYFLKTLAFLFRMMYNSRIIFQIGISRRRKVPQYTYFDFTKGADNDAAGYYCFR